LGGRSRVCLGLLLRFNIRARQRLIALGLCLCLRGVHAVGSEAMSGRVARAVPLRPLPPCPPCGRAQVEAKASLVLAPPPSVRLGHGRLSGARLRHVQLLAPSSSGREHAPAPSPPHRALADRLLDCSATAPAAGDRPSRLGLVGLLRSPTLLVPALVTSCCRQARPPPLALRRPRHSPRMCVAPPRSNPRLGAASALLPCSCLPQSPCAWPGHQPPRLAISPHYRIPLHSLPLQHSFLSPAAPRSTTATRPFPPVPRARVAVAPRATSGCTAAACCCALAPPRSLIDPSPPLPPLPCCCRPAAEPWARVATAPRHATGRAATFRGYALVQVCPRAASPPSIASTRPEIDRFSPPSRSSSALPLCSGELRRVLPPCLGPLVGRPST
jgi:hypothetical protein